MTNFYRFEAISLRKIFLAFFAVSALCLFIARSVNTFGYLNLTSQNPLFSGDEPKYLRMAYSLTKDGDVDLSDLIVTPQEREQIRAEALRRGSFGFAGIYVVGRDGRIYGLHLPGIAAFLWPAFALDSRRFPPDPTKSPKELFFLPQELNATRLWLMVTAFLTLLLAIRFLDKIFRCLFLEVVLILFWVLNSPFPDYSYLIYPEAVSTLFFLLTLNAILFPYRRRWLNDAFIVAGISALPWLHQRYIPAALGLFLVFLLNSRWTRPGRKRLAVLCAGFVLTSLPYLYYFYSITGNPSPLSPQLAAIGGVFARTRTLPLGFFGQIFSRDWGLLWFSPWLIFVMIGFYRTFKTDRSIALSLSIILVPYYLMCSAASPWNASTYPPGRFLEPLLPLLLVFAGFALRDLFRRFSIPRLVVYGGWLLAVLLNAKTGWLNLDFGFSTVNSREFLRMGICFFLLLVLYLSLYASDKFPSKRVETASESLRAR
jgi:hypothetical protein